MRLSKYFICLFLVTFIGLLYSHQHFLIVKANYDIKKYENQISQLLDRNCKLMYNVTTLEAPAKLEARLHNEGIDYDVPRGWAVVKRLKSEAAYELAKAVERRNVVLETIFNFMTRKAEAQPFEN